MVVDLLEGIVSESNKICRVVFAHTNRVVYALKNTVLTEINLWWFRLRREEEERKGEGWGGEGERIR